MRVLTSPADTGRSHPGPARRTSRPRPSTSRQSSSTSASGHIPRNRPDADCAPARGGVDPRSRTPHDHRRRRRALQRGHRRPAQLRRRRPASPWARPWPARAACATTIRSAWAPSASTGTIGRQRHRRGGRPRHRHRHALQRLHHGQQDPVPAPGRALRQHQRGRVRRLQAQRACRWWATPGPRWRNWRARLGGYRAPDDAQRRGQPPARRMGGRGRPHLRHPQRAAAQPGRD